MNKLLPILLILFTLSACQPTQEVLPTPSFIPEPIEQKTTSKSTHSPVPALDILGYQVKIV